MSADGPLPGVSKGIALLSAWTMTAHEAARLDPYPEWQRLIRGRETSAQSGHGCGG
jgi:hypothetical protein